MASLFDKENHVRLVRYLLLSIMTIASVVLVSWLMGYGDFVGNLAGATMKFNTALVFLTSSLGTFLLYTNWKYQKTFMFLLASIGLGISCIIQYAYIFEVDVVFIDELFVKDPLSQLFPGRMSPATSFNFVLFNLGLLFHESRRPKVLLVVQNLLIVILFISLISIISYVLLIPSVHRTIGFATMSIHTSILFLVLASTLYFKDQNVGLLKILWGTYSGSRLLRSIWPIILFLPIVLSIGLILLINNQTLEVDFGIAVYTVLFIVVGFGYITNLAFGMNRSDMKRDALEQSLVKVNNELTDFKRGLDATSIVMIWNPKGEIIYTNDQFSTVTGYTQEEALGKTFSLLQSDYHDPSFYMNMVYTMNRGIIWSNEINHIAKDGSSFWVYTSVVPFTDSEGKIYQFLTLSQDITSKKKAEELLNSQYVKKLEVKNKELEQFAYIASHDLQEPLRTVSSFVQILSEYENKPFDDVASKSMAFIRQASDRMSALIKGLLDYSRIGQQRVLETVNIGELIEDVRDNLSALIVEKGAHVVINSLAMPELEVNRTDMTMLFQNLIGNGIKFVQKDTTPVVTIDAKRQDDGWLFSIADNGIGIPERYQKKIFIIFQRLHNKSDYEGTGIGLAHCQKIVQLYGGEIWLTSKVGEGTTFFFNLPDQILVK